MRRRVRMTHYIGGGPKLRGLTVASSDDPGIPVADAIEVLRDELEAALTKGVGRSVQFGVSDVTLTVNVVASKSKGAEGKIRWWVVEAGGSAAWSREVTQTLVLTLHPERGRQQPRLAPQAVAGKWPTGHPS